MRKGQIVKILLALCLIGALVAGDLWMRGIDPFSQEGADLVGQTIEEVLSSSNRQIALASKKTTEETAKAVTDQTSESTRTETKKPSEKTTEKVTKEDESIGDSIEDRIDWISSFLPGWIPGRPYVVMCAILAGLVFLIVLVNRKLY